MDKALRYLALARKAGSLSVGEFLCGETMSAGKGKLLLLASDASDNAAKRAQGFLNGRRALFGRLPWTKAELSALLGKAGCSMLCFTALGLAAEFAAALAEADETWKETATLLAARRDKAVRRKAAPRKHKPNDKGGQMNGS